jgi:hypothetical protein
MNREDATNKLHESQQYDLPKTIGGFLPDFEKRFKLLPNETLFGLDWKNLTKTSCPVCGCKLHYSRNKNLYICRSITHRRKFVIKRPDLERIVKSYEPGSNSRPSSGKR